MNLEAEGSGLKNGASSELSVAQYNFVPTEGFANMVASYGLKVGGSEPTTFSYQFRVRLANGQMPASRVTLTGAILVAAPDNRVTRIQLRCPDVVVHY
jgi:hypothetical protein